MNITPPWPEIGCFSSCEWHWCYDPKSNPVHRCECAKETLTPLSDFLVDLRDLVSAAYRCGQFIQEQFTAAHILSLGSRSVHWNFKWGVHTHYSGVYPHIHHKYLYMGVPIPYYYHNTYKWSLQLANCGSSMFYFLFYIWFFTKVQTIKTITHTNSASTFYIDNMHATIQLIKNKNSQWCKDIWRVVGVRVI